MKKRIFAIICVLLMFMLNLAGCGSKEAHYEDYVAESGGVSMEMNESVEVSESGALKDRKLIENVHISVQTRAYDDFLSNITVAVSEHGGYIEHSDVTNNTDYTDNRYAYLTIRIPADKLGEFTSLISEIGTVTNKTTSIEDITLQYVDTESHIKALRTEEETLLRLIEEAEDLDDILAVQSRLTEVRYQLESYESQLRTFDNKINFATVDLSVHEVEREVVGKDSETVWDEIGANILTAFYNIGRFFRGLFIFALSALPYLAVIAAVVVPILYFTVIRPKRKKKNNNE